MTINLKHSALKFSTFLLISFLFLISCSKDEVVPLSDECLLKEVSFSVAQNPNMTELPCVVFINNNVYITANNGVNLSALTLTCKTSDKATVSINGTESSSNTITSDFTNEKEITIVSESKNRNFKYKFIVKSGNPKADVLAYNFMKKFSIPGISFAVSKNENIVYSSAVGYAVDNLVRMRTDHLFRLASVSKSMTAICIMTQIENNKYGINDKVFGPSGLLPEYTASGKALDVTVRHLLEHTSGWPNATDAMFSSVAYGKSVDWRIDHTLNTLQQSYTPGVTHSYLNMGYVILGKIIEKFSGVNYETYLRSVMAKAGVTDIWVGATSQSNKKTNEVVYYSQDGKNGYGNEMDVLAAAGGVICSTGEMMKILFAVDGLSSVPDVLKPATRELMLTPVGYNRYAMGWRCNYPTSILADTYYHAGNLAGTAPIWFMGKYGKNAVVLMNSRNYASTFDDEQYQLISDIAAKF